jgi:hypothetical protein
MGKKEKVMQFGDIEKLVFLIGMDPLLNYLAWKHMMGDN